MKKPKKKTRTYWRKRCCIIAKKIVRTQANFTCAYCGQKEPNVATHGSHIYAEGVYTNMSADLDNIICLCFTHHTGGWNASQPSWHKDPMFMVEWFNTNYPERAKELRLRTQKRYDVDFEKKYYELKQILADLQS